MTFRHWNIGCLALFFLSAAVSPAAAQPNGEIIPASATEISRIPLEALTPADREKVRVVLDNPTMVTGGQPEMFLCQPEHYYWLVEHPDQAARLWRCLGVKCADIQDRGGYYSSDDAKGSTVTWHTVYRGTDRSVWYAEGKVNPGLLLPTASIKAVMVLHHSEIRDPQGHPGVRHSVELFLHTDSHAAAAAAKIVGASVPHLAQQYVTQIQVFFEALAWYLDQHPRNAEALFGQLRQPASTDHPLKFTAQ